MFLLASLLVCLLTLRLSINIKHLCLFFHSLPILTDFLKFLPLPPFLLTLHLLNLTKIANPPFYFDPPFIKHLRVRFFKNTRFHHDICRGFAHKCSPAFRYSKLNCLEQTNTFICKQFHSFIKRIQASARRLTQAHFTFSFQFFYRTMKRNATGKH